MTFLNWGNVPEWLAAGSLLLAFRIFMRDRSASDRAQVDKVAIWGNIKRDISIPGGKRIDDVEVQVTIRNASDLPVEVNQLAWTFQTVWLIPDAQSSPVLPIRRSEKGKADVMRFLGAVGVAPKRPWQSQWYPINLTHTAPADDAQLLFFSEGVKCVICYALITDNAGRRWEARQRQGKLAKRIRWYSRSGPHYPVEWQSPIGRWFRVIKARSKARLGRARDQARNRTRPSVASDLPGGSQTGSASGSAGDQGQSG